MKIQVISYGRNKKGYNTAQIVIKQNGTSQTRHLWQYGDRWADKDGKTYDVAEPKKQAA